MFKWLAIFALLWATPAFAQNPTCPTRPLGDSTNACASTAFVQSAIQSIIDAGLPLATTSQLYGGSGTAGQANVVSIGAGLSLTGEVLSATPQAITNVSGSNQNTTGNCIASNTAITLLAAKDFVNGQGISLEHCGATFTGAAPTGLTIASTGATFQGPAGSTTYYYDIACVDDSGGVGVAVAEAHITNGAATLGAVVQSSTPTLAWNTVSWSTTCPAVAVWRSIGNDTTYHLIGVFTNTGAGTLVYDSGLPQVTIPWIPDTPTGAALADRLVTTIASGGGTVNLTLGAAPTTSVTGAYVRHDDTAALGTYLSATPQAVLPNGTYNVEAVTLPTTVVSFSGGGPASTTIVGWKVTEPTILANTMPAAFAIHDLAISTISMGVPTALEVEASNDCRIYNLYLSAATGLLLSSDNRCNVANMNIPVWYVIGIEDTIGTNNSIGNNYIALTKNLAQGDGVLLLNTSYDLIHNNNLNGTFFGILAQGSGGTSDHNTIRSNSVNNSWREGYHLSGSVNYNMIANNYEFGGTTSIDFCASISNDTLSSVNEIGNEVRGNWFGNCGSSGVAIGVVGGGVSGVVCDFNVIADNTIWNPNVDGQAGLGAIQVNGATTSGTKINGNTLVDGTNAPAWVVLEFTSDGTPDHTQVGTMFGDTGSSGKTSFVGTGSSALTGGSTGI